MKVSEILVGALELLGLDGEHWIKDALVKEDQDRDEYSYCMVGALAKAAGINDNLLEGDLAYPGNDITKDYIEFNQAASLLKSSLSKTVRGIRFTVDSIPAFNDHVITEFSDVKQAFCAATKLALEQEGDNDNLLEEAPVLDAK